MKKIEMSEIAQLKVDLRNKTSMYENQKNLNQKLKEEIKELKLENTKLKLLVEELLIKFKQQDDLILELKNKIDKLEKNSSNSSKPPSTDIVKKNKSLRKNTGNKSGGQKGHKGGCKNQVDNPDKIIECKPLKCSVCGKEFTNDDKFKTISKRQSLDIGKILKIVTEYRLMGIKCSCGYEEKGEYPKDIKWA